MSVPGEPPSDSEIAADRLDSTGECKISARQSGHSARVTAVRPDHDYGMDMTANIHLNGHHSSSIPQSQNHVSSQNTIQLVFFLLAPPHQ